MISPILVISDLIKRANSSELLATTSTPALPINLGSAPLSPCWLARLSAFIMALGVFLGANNPIAASELQRATPGLVVSAWELSQQLRALCCF
jgi:hypothetical protein